MGEGYCGCKFTLLFQKNVKFKDHQERKKRRVGRKERNEGRKEKISKKDIHDTNETDKIFF